MPSKVYLYYPVKEELLSCVACAHPYALDAPLSTLKKHLRVKHGLSIRHPPASRGMDIVSMLNPEPTASQPSVGNFRFINYHP